MEDASRDRAPHIVASSRAAVGLAGLLPEDLSPKIQWGPEHSLMLAILEDAVACYRHGVARPRQNPLLLARQAEFWFRMEDWDSPFSFNNICTALDLDPAATRERLLGAGQRVAA